MYQQGYQVPQQQYPPQQPMRPGQPPKKKKRHTFLYLALILLLIAGMTGGAYYLKVYLEVKPFESVYLHNIYIDDIPLGGKTPDEAAREVFTHVRNRQNSWHLDLKNGDHTYYTLTYETMGIHTDEQEVLNLLNQALVLGHQGSTFDRKKDMDSLAAEPFKAYTMQSSMTDQYLDSILSQIAADMYRAPSDAFLMSFSPDEKDPFTIQSERYGQSLNTEKAKAEILQHLSSASSGAYQLAPDVLSPNVTEKDVRKTVTLLGTGITPIAKNSEENRNNNIRVAFSHYNGMIVKPGEKVSFNRTVGERTQANGFYPAYEYISGNLETGIGGGVCQASTTVYMAALLSDLEIVDRESHADEVSYTTFGQDATVYWNGNRKIDFVFKNTSEGNIYITAHVEKVKSKTYRCVVRIYGMALPEGVSFKLKTETVETIPAPEEPEYIKDSSVSEGKEELVRKARDGFINETYLERWENGTLVSREFVSRDTCKARSAIYKINPGTNKN